MFRSYPIDNRIDAGMQISLNEKIKIYSHRNDTLILALPRGGIPVAYQLSCQLKIPFDMIFVRKLGLPSHEETAMGAIGINDIIIYNENCIVSNSITKLTIEEAIKKERIELARRSKEYRGNRPFPKIKDKNIILVDDGIASGASMKAAIATVKSFGPKSIIVAVPVGPPEVINELKLLVDDVICIHQPSPFHAVGLWYGHFPQLKDNEVLKYIESSYKIIDENFKNEDSIYLN
ncbi:phosphoribosyltransferase [Anaeromyces robustus]|uniref:Phosphoribosyltransferase n=1 Tax=Anaeromyces robustus TaxID=1754192 RepID=A0A1Y1XRK5_9FUNG|nr:phosphoribosyltransferase [Anaeromyces robustus]|eukprot:ORX88126.1 phosphoribosyltransferase [Anaeromyces robustus]